MFEKRFFLTGKHQKFVALLQTRYKIMRFKFREGIRLCNIVNICKINFACLLMRKQRKRTESFYSSSVFLYVCKAYCRLACTLYSVLKSKELRKFNFSSNFSNNQSRIMHTDTERIQTNNTDTERKVLVKIWLAIQITSSSLCSTIIFLLKINLNTFTTSEIWW